MTTPQYTPLVLNRRDLFLHELRNVNFALFRAFQNVDQVEVFIPSTRTKGLMELILEKSRFFLWSSESYVLEYASYDKRVKNTTVPLSKAKDYAPRLSSDELFYHCGYDRLLKLRRLLESKYRNWFDLSTETEVKYIDDNYDKILSASDIWKLKNAEYWLYLYDERIFKSRVYEQNGQEAVFVHDGRAGFLKLNDPKLGIAVSLDKISVLAECRDSQMFHFENYQWKIGNDLCYDYVHYRKILHTKISGNACNVTRPRYSTNSPHLLIVTHRKTKFIPMSRILLADDKIWKKSKSEIDHIKPVKEIKEGYLQETVCEQTNFVAGQNVRSQTYGHAVVVSVLMDIKGNFTEKILIKVGTTHLVVPVSDLSICD